MKTSQAISPQLFGEIAAKVGHLSSKSVNTNVFTGIRYAPEDAVGLPYVSVRSMLAVPGIFRDLMDYQLNAALFPYAKKLLGMESPAPDCAPEDKEQLVSRALLGEQDAVNARLRQVLLPLQDDQYVSVTPLESSGLGALLRFRIKPYLDPENEIPGWRKPKLASMPIGGKKPQNVGIRVRDMACLFIETPTVNATIQSAVRAAYKGIRVLPSVKLLHQWRDSGQLASLCAGLGNRTEKDLFYESVQPLARNILERANIASIQVRTRLEDQTEDDREEAWGEIEARLDFVQFRFIKPELRTPKWAKRAAWAISDAIAPWLIQQAGKRNLSEAGPKLILTASAKTVLVDAFARELT